MTPLERRCRRAVRLLPREERAARGEEILGVMLDLSAGRDRPPAGEVLAVSVLAAQLRLKARARRLRGILPELAAAIVIVTVTQPVANAVHWVGRVDPGMTPVVLVIAVAWMATGIGYLLGFRWGLYLWWLLIAVNLAGVAYAGLRLPLGFSALVQYAMHDVVAAVVVGIAGRRGTPPVVRPRPAWFAVLAVTFAEWVTLDRITFQVEPKAEFLAAAVVVAVVAGVLAVTARRRVAGAMPAVLVVTSLAAVGVLSLWIGLTVTAAVLGVAVSPRTPAYASTPSTSLVT